MVETGGRYPCEREPWSGRARPPTPTTAPPAHLMAASRHPPRLGTSSARRPGCCPRSPTLPATAPWPRSCSLSMCRIPPGTSSPTCARIETWDLLTSRLGDSLSWEAGDQRPGVQILLGHKTGASSPKPGTTRTRQPTDRSPRPPGARVAVPLPPDHEVAVTVRPIARLFPPPPAPLSVGRAGRAWPVPCRWPHCRLGGCGLRDWPHRRLWPGRGAITSALCWRGGHRLTLTS